MERQRSTHRPRRRPLISRRTAALARAASLLDVALDLEQALGAVAQLFVPDIADVCLVDLLDDDGRPQRAATAHAEAHAALAAGAPPPAAEQLRAGAPAALVPQAPGEDAPASWLVAPLVRGERVIGAITLGSAAPHPPFGARDLALAAELAGRCAAALDMALRLRQAEDNLRARDELFDLVAHDLKNPLTVIIGSIQLLQRRIAQPDGLAEPATLARRLEQVSASAIQIRTMVNDLLDLARVRADRPLELLCEHTDLVALVRRAAAEYQHTTSRHHISVETTLRDLVGMWDAPRIERAVANLLANAIKYSPAGGVVTVGLRRDEQDDGAWAVLTVSDRGIGIPSSDVAHIFERFHRAGNAPSRVSGSGMGLASAGMVVEQHGGTIDVTSAEGVGSTFTVRLPIR